VSVAATLIVVTILGLRYGSGIQRQRIMGQHLFVEIGLPVFASLDGDRDFHEMMSAFRMGEVREGLRLLESLESRHRESNDTLSYFGGWLHYMERDYEKSAARFAIAAADTSSVFQDKARLMEAASLCLGRNKDKSMMLLESMSRDHGYTLKREAVAILSEKRLW
jgi:hypothetical protein